MKSAVLTILLFLVPLLSQAGTDESRTVTGTASTGLTRVAEVMGCDLKTACEIDALNLDPSLAQLLMRLCAKSQVTAAQIMQERATRHWGEVCALHGQDWVALNDEVEALARDAQLPVVAPSPVQILRSCANRPETLKTSGLIPQRKSAQGDGHEH